MNVPGKQSILIMIKCHSSDVASEGVPIAELDLDKLDN